MQENMEQEISKVKILNDVYKNENERLKIEYRLLVDEFEKYKEASKDSKIKKIVKKIVFKLKKVFAK